MAVTVVPFALADRDGVIGVILPIQQEEFGVPITAADQPDLMAIPDFYQAADGGFWVAKADEVVVGTIGLKDIGERQAALRKMFVAAPYRGREHGVASRLLQALLAHARARRLSRIYLGTTDKFLAAHRFYEKNGFHLVDVADLPESFPRMAVDTRFYAVDL